MRAAQCERLDSLVQHEPKLHTKSREREAVLLEAVCWLCRSGAVCAARGVALAARIRWCVE